MVGLGQPVEDRFQIPGQAAARGVVCSEQIQRSCRAGKGLSDVHGQGNGPEPEVHRGGLRHRKTPLVSSCEAHLRYDDLADERRSADRFEQDAGT